MLCCVCQTRNRLKPKLLTPKSLQTQKNANPNFFSTAVYKCARAHSRNLVCFRFHFSTGQDVFTLVCAANSIFEILTSVKIATDQDVRHGGDDPLADHASTSSKKGTGSTNCTSGCTSATSISRSSTSSSGTSFTISSGGKFQRTGAYSHRSTT